ncbi:hypothetical protein ACUSIJ_00075 [Pseudochelatococcus sp. B33]
MADGIRFVVRRSAGFCQMKWLGPQEFSSSRILNLSDRRGHPGKEAGMRKAVSDDSAAGAAF